jgi:hypothetical protein
MVYKFGEQVKHGKNNIKKYIAGIAASIVVISGAGGVALAGNSGTGAEYHPQGSACGQYHGAFGYFGKDNNLAGGADGQATGDANSAKGCQNNADTAPGLQP